MVSYAKMQVKHQHLGVSPHPEADPVSIVYQGLRSFDIDHAEMQHTVLHDAHQTLHVYDSKGTEGE